MRAHLLLAVIGLGSGVGGALLVERLHQAPEAPRPVAAVTPQPVAAWFPPGWDRYTSRLARVEERLGSLEAQRKDGAAPAAAAEAAPPPSQREVERAAHYQKELEYRRQLIADHDREVVDPTWAAATSNEVHQMLAPQSDRFDVKNVDCRARTCVADLVFPQPADALRYIQGYDALAPSSCNGSIAIPTPPENDGPYDMTIVYTCR
jgi:hypothetical protein